jgi:peptidoglycan-associated lipoprotein
VNHEIEDDHEDFRLNLIVGLALVSPGCVKKDAMNEAAPVEKQAIVEKQAAAPTETGKEKALEEALEKERAKERALAEELAREMAKEKATATAAAAAAKEASEFADIHFVFDRSELRPDDQEILRMHASWLKAHPEYVVRIEGNCDERGTVEYNLALGERRAVSAMNYLVHLGVDKSTITTISYGKERPFDPGHNEKAWAKNRRDHFVVARKK